MSFTAPCFSGLLFLGCINALAYNLIHSLVIKITSAVTTTVIGEMKIVLILVLSAVVLGEGNEISPFGGWACLEGASWMAD